MSDYDLEKPSGPYPPVFLLMALVLMVVLHFLVPLGHFSIWSWRMGFSGILLAAGIGLNLWADSLFKRAGTSVKPFDPTTTLIADGPYAFTRHPRYLGMVFILAAVASALGSLSPWLIVPIFVWQINQRFIVPEEANLKVRLAQFMLNTNAKFVVGSRIVQYIRVRGGFQLIADCVAPLNKI